MKTPKNPKSQTEEVLFFLLTRISIDRRQMMLSSGVLNLPDQIMRLRRRYGLKIDLKKISVINKFGRVVEFGEYILQDKKEALKIYNQMQLNTSKNE